MTDEPLDALEAKALATRSWLNFNPREVLPLIAELRRLRKMEETLRSFEQAYPEDVFPPTTQEERELIIQQYPGFIDRTSAMMGRHIVKALKADSATG